MSLLAPGALLMTAHYGLPMCEGVRPTANNLFRSYGQVDKIYIYNSDTPAFYRMFNLVTNFDRINNIDYTQYAVTATLLVLYLEQFTSFFSQDMGMLRGVEKHKFASAFLFRALGQLVCNGHTTLHLVSIKDKNGRVTAQRDVHCATAIYPSAAMMNHACQPNIINTFYKNRLIVRCARKLPAGAQLQNCYGPHSSRVTTVQRRQQLRFQYQFYCMCSECSDSYRDQFTTLFTAYMCQACKGPVMWRRYRAACQQCHLTFHVEKAIMVLDKAEEIDLQGVAVARWIGVLFYFECAHTERSTSIEEKCERLQDSLCLKQQVWHRHHMSLRISIDLLAKAFAEAGEYTKSVELIKHNIQSLEYQYGSFSVEVTHELRKLLTVMLARIVKSPQHADYREWCLETHKIARKAIQLTELNYGSWVPMLVHLEEQARFVGAIVRDTAAGLSDDNVHHSLHYNLKI